LNTIDEENNEYKRQIFLYFFEIHLQIHDFLDFKLLTQNTDGCQNWDGIASWSDHIFVPVIKPFIPSSITRRESICISNVST
jgi:hypothetical protein